MAHENVRKHIDGKGIDTLSFVGAEDYVHLKASAMVVFRLVSPVFIRGRKI